MSVSASANTGLRLQPGQRLSINTSLRQTIMVLAMRGHSIKRLAKEMAGDNPYLEVVLPSGLPVSAAGTATAPDFDRIDHDTVHPVSLGQHIVNEINLLFSDPDRKAVALLLAEHVSPAGWLDPDGVAQAEAAGIAGPEFDGILGILQTMDPPGLFARNLAECLRIQLERMDEYDDDAKRVLLRLSHMETGGVEGLVRESGLARSRVEAVLQRLRRCNPKPGAAFIHDEGEIFRPDLTIESDGDGFTVAVNRDSLPEIRVRDLETGDAAARLMMKQARSEARMLSTAIRQRSEMLLAAGGILARHQADFLRHGEKFIRPLSMQELADRLDCHKGTVSRLVADKLCHTPRGMLALKEFFATRLRQDNGGFVAGRAVAARVVEAVNSENRGSPHSDKAIVAMLAADGFGVARRTIAKYRRINSIPRWQDRREPAPTGAASSSPALGG